MRLPSTLLLLLAASLAQANPKPYLIGGGVDTDSDGGLRGSMLAGVELDESTWLSGGMSASSVELASGRSSDIIYADFDVDHHFDPVGLTFGVAYWGDPDILNSLDQRLSLYYRNRRFYIGAEYEYRDFDLIIPPGDFFPGRELTFDANGVGGRLRYSFTENFRASLSAMKYDYSVDFTPGDNIDAARLISVSRLSLINSLIDSRASIDLGLDVGSGNWSLDYATWKGALDQSRTDSYTLRYLWPVSVTTDIELGLGYDDSDLYGDVTFLSLYLYFYGS